jgi:hypothetical protein
LQENWRLVLVNKEHVNITRIYNNQSYQSS